MSRGDVVSDHWQTRGRAICAAVLALGVLLAVMLWMAPAFACTVLADVQTRPGLGDPGAVIRVDGAGFDPAGGPVTIYWAGQTQRASIATVAPADGSFSVDVTVPINAVLHSEYQIEAEQATSPQHFGSTLFRIPAQAPTAQPPAQVAPAPAVAPAASRPHAAVAQQPASVQQPVSVQHPAAANQPVSAPADASGFSQAGAPAFANGGEPIAPISQPTGNFGGVARGAGGRSPWILLPIGVLGLGLFSAGAAATVRQAKREGVRAPV